jgi:hypothetical protein
MVDGNERKESKNHYICVQDPWIRLTRSIPAPYSLHTRSMPDPRPVGLGLGLFRLQFWFQLHFLTILTLPNAVYAFVLTKTLSKIPEKYTQYFLDVFNGF